MKRFTSPGHAQRLLSALRLFGPSLCLKVFETSNLVHFDVFL
jgi:hypothetical protein